MPADSIANLAANVATEFIGTMFLCLTVSLTAKANPLLAPLAIGFVLMVVIYAGGHASGANYNPAVTLAILVRGALKPLDALLYVFAQFAGAAAGGGISIALITKEASGYPSIGKVYGAKVPIGSALLCEIMLTFALCYTVLNCATSKRQVNNSYYGLAIGCTVLSGAVSVGGLSGGAFNPAVGILPWLHGEFEDTWIYWAGPLVGGVLAGCIFRLIEPGEYSETPNKTLEMIAPFIVELIGTMMLCYTVGCAAGIGSGCFVQLSIGSMLMCQIYAGGAISGAHYNPAVTLAVLGRTVFRPMHDVFRAHKALAYIISQLVGAALATLLAWASLPKVELVGHPKVPYESEIGKGFVGEIIGTFLLVFVVLNVATVKAVAGNEFFGIAIGQTVTAMAIAIGPISGGAFNPAVGLISLLVGPCAGRDAHGIWIYWVACPIGAVLALCFFRLQNFTEFQGKKDVKHLQFHVDAGNVHNDHTYHIHIHEKKLASPGKEVEAVEI